MIQLNTLMLERGTCISRSHFHFSFLVLRFLPLFVSKSSLEYSTHIHLRGNYHSLIRIAFLLLRVLYFYVHCLD